MRETIGDWKKEWIDTNGKTNDLEVLIRFNNSDGYIYEGSFFNIPEEFEVKKVVNCSRVLDSTIKARIGAYVLEVE